MARTKANTQEIPKIEAVVPTAAIPGGEVELLGESLGPVAQRQPIVMVGQLAASVLLSRSRRIKLKVPDEAETGPVRVLQNGAQSNDARVLVAGMIATDLHIVANPAVD
ncbi:MAG TPA: gluconolaconase, partial [Pseudacidobacterium sp.]|nr:gluconolaconase [Pseudacidobacterium sp.]